MFEAPPREKEWQSWLYAGLLALVIFCMVPLTRTVQAFVAEHIGRGIFTYVVFAAIAIGALAAVRYLWRRPMPGRSGYFWLAAVAAAFAWYTVVLSGDPEESLHFVEYGVLSLLLYRALSHRVRDPSIYVAAALIGAMVGMMDEAIQWITPGRYWGLRDIWFNVFAVVLVQVGIALGLRPGLIAGWPTAASMRRLCRLALAALLLFGFGLMNTPPRILLYADLIPSLHVFKHGGGVMAEYGYLYEDPEIGVFRSRLTAEALARNDAARGAEAAAILDRYQARESYAGMLERYTPINDPFVHEARVHLFRRDYYLAKAEEGGPTLERYREFLTIAYRENRIMEKYYPHTLGRSAYVFPPEKIAMLREQALDEPYDSNVGGQIITRLSEWQVAVLLALALLGLVIAERYFARRSRRQSAERAASP